jgi:creatinine amidohydrolase
VTVPEGEVYIERMTWPEIEAAIAQGKRTAVIVAASSEQHGPHLPEATDAILGEELAGRLARRLGNALAAPVIRPGCSDHHMSFAGSLTITAELLMAILDAYLDSLRRHGFNRFVVTSSHGGNFPVLADWKRNQPKDVVVIDDFEGFAEALFSALSRSGRDDRGGPHADLGETSAVLAVRPELVRTDKIAAGRTEPAPLPEVLEKGLRALTPNGVLGDPRGATPEIGSAVLDSLTHFLAAKIPDLEHS